jgi:N-acetylmuramoyl-L-alanine amidase
MRPKSLIFCLIITIVGNIFAETKLTRIVLDAGHGGHDSGAVGKISYEKEVVLKIVEQLGEKIKTEFPDVEVFYTRKSDVFVELWKRTQLANEHKGNLFISIHCNSNDTKNGRAPGSGFETYVMGLHKSERSLEVAMKENASIFQEKNYTEIYEGFNPNDPDSYIIMANMQGGLFGHLNMSIKMASLIQEKMGKAVTYPDRKVQQAGFRVLYGLRMPSVLAEIGFINNPEEEKFMNSAEGEKIIVKALFDAVAEYKVFLEENGDSNNGDSNTNISTTTITSSTTTTTSSSSYTTPTPTPTPTISPTTPTTPTTSITPTTPKITTIYKVQFATSSTNKSTFVFDIKEASPVANYYHDGLYKYTAGEFNNYEDAKKLQDKIRNHGYKDAFVVKFVNGIRQ